MPPPVSAPPTPTPSLKRSPSVKSTANGGGDDFQDELSVVLSLVKDKPRFLIRQTPEVFISQKSSAQEVQNWLRAKEFSPEICAGLRKYSGYALMSLQRDQIDRICGPEEGKRLHSQISIQKSVSGVRKEISFADQTETNILIQYGLFSGRCICISTHIINF